MQFYTSGTTGLPKGAELTNRNFTAMLPLWTREWLLAPGVPNLVCLPMFHIGGAGWGIAACCCIAACNCEACSMFGGIVLLTAYTGWVEWKA